MTAHFYLNKPQVRAQPNIFLGRKKNIIYNNMQAENLGKNIKTGFLKSECYYLPSCII